MPKTTPFHLRLKPLNRTQIWKNWSGYLVAPRYQYSETNEYYAIRNSVSLLDTSPLFKYRFSGPEANLLLTRAMVRNINSCASGQAQYTAWCNDAGFVVQDGVIMRITDSEFWLTSAEPSLRHFRNIARDMNLTNVSVEDISCEYGILAMQGPHAFNVIQQLTGDAESLKYFHLVRTQIDHRSVVISRTGFTGDLGFEIWIQSNDAVPVWDAIMSAGSGFNITPIGTTALKMSRVEAGLLLLGVDFQSARFARVDAERETPIELGWKWMLGDINQDDREFVGRTAIQNEMANHTSRWTTTGLAVDWHDYERVHLNAGIAPPKHELYREATMSIYRRGTQEWDYAGYASSFLFSSLLRKPLAIAKLPLELSNPGTEVDLEFPVIKKPQNILARVHSMPFYNPSRKTAKLNTGNKNA